VVQAFFFQDYKYGHIDLPMQLLGKPEPSSMMRTTLKKHVCNLANGMKESPHKLNLVAPILVICFC